MNYSLGTVRAQLTEVAVHTDVQLLVEDPCLVGREQRAQGGCLSLRAVASYANRAYLGGRIDGDTETEGDHHD
jgi:hypothetical protein